MCSKYLPPGLEAEVHDAIVALASCEGLGASHLATIRFCITACRDGFERAYASYFENMVAAAASDTSTPSKHYRPQTTKE